MVEPNSPATIRGSRKGRMFHVERLCRFELDAFGVESECGKRPGEPVSFLEFLEVECSTWNYFLPSRNPQSNLCSM